MKVYLGGVLQNSTALKDKIVNGLKASCFDPSTVDDSYEGYIKKKAELDSSDFCLHIISPSMEGFREIINVVDDSNKHPDRTIYCYVEEDEKKAFTSHQAKSLLRIGEMVEKNGAVWLKNIDEVLTFLNERS